MLSSRPKLAVAFSVAAALFAVSRSGSAQAPSREAEQGLGLLRSQGCLACHTLDGSRQVGPTLLGLWGSSRSVKTGESRRVVSVDTSYVERSLKEPDADVVEGFPAGVMPKFALSDADSRAIVAALTHLSQNAKPKPRGSLLSLGLAALAFVVLHLGMSSHPLRSRATSKLGANAFMGLYSLVILGVFGWLLHAWSTAPYLQLWASPAWTRHVPLVSMPLIFVLMIAGYTTKNPASAGQESALEKPDAATGILRITRHPANVANALWGFVHLPPNGDFASLCLFGSISLLAIVGTLHIERRRRRAHGAAWEAFARVTSIVPFVAILRGRNQLRLSEIGAWRVLLGLAIFVIALASHTYLIGASPYPL